LRTDRLRTRDVVLLSLGLLHALATIPFLDPQLLDTDWRAFYESSAAWLTGGDVYSAAYRANYLPPWAVVLMAPLVPFGLRGSFAIWTLLNLALIVWTCRHILKARPEIPWSFLVVSVLSLLPASYVWLHGQLTWVLFACLTRAWLAPTPRQAALWLAPVMMIKPPFMLLACALPWRIGIPAAVRAIAYSAATIPFLQLPIWADWWSMRLEDATLGFFNNASLIGLAARLEYGPLTPIQLHWLDPRWLLPAGLIAALCWWNTQKTQGDARWARSWLWAILVMPIGWLNYLPAAAGPILSTANHRTLAIVAVLMLLPRHAMWALAMTGGWVAFVAACLGIASVFLLWLACQNRNLAASVESPAPPMNSQWTPDQYLTAHQTSLKATQAKVAADALDVAALKDEVIRLQGENFTLKRQAPVRTKES
jgi:hypothetical protein